MKCHSYIHVTFNFCELSTFNCRKTIQHYPPLQLSSIYPLLVPIPHMLTNVLFDVKHFFRLQSVAFPDPVFSLYTEVVGSLLLDVINFERALTNILSNGGPISEIFLPIFTKIVEVFQSFQIIILAYSFSTLSKLTFQCTSLYPTIFGSIQPNQKVVG